MLALAEALGHDQTKASRTVMTLHGGSLPLIGTLLTMAEGAFRLCPFPAGDTIIEKLESKIDVRYACVLLTPDDEGYRAGNDAEKNPARGKM